MKLRASVLAAALLACSTDPDAGGGGGSVSAPTPPGDPGEYVALGMNDVTILVPAPNTASDPLMLASDTMDDGTPLVPRELFERLALEPVPEAGTMATVNAELYKDLQLVAVRFDLCDRNVPGPCKGDADGRVRLVLQPFQETRGGFADVGFHAFFSVPFADLASLVKDVRELATIQKEPTSSPLEVSPALTAGNAEYRDALRLLVRRWTGERKLVRLTMNAQPQLLSQVRWAMRGVEKKDGNFVNIAIPGMSGTTQEVITSGATGFESKPLADLPAGILEAANDRAFGDASDGRKRELLGVLATADNPNTSAPDTVSCIACHISTSLMKARSTTAGVDPTSVAGRFTSTYDLSIKGNLADRHVIRALGYIGRDVLISQRVVNDSAQVLQELEARFPR